MYMYIEKIITNFAKILFSLLKYFQTPTQEIPQGQTMNTLIHTCTQDLTCLIFSGLMNTDSRYSDILSTSWTFFLDMPYWPTQDGSGGVAGGGVSWL